MNGRTTKCTVRVCLGIIISKIYIIDAGKGQYVWKKSGALYDGDWKEDKRNGFGTYSVLRDGSLVKEYAGGWKNDMRHVRFAHTPSMALRDNLSNRDMAHASTMPKSIMRVNGTLT